MLVQRLTMKRKYSSNCITAVDKTAVWLNKVGNITVNTTGAKDIPLKSTGNEKLWVSVCWTAQVNGTQMKPFVIFQGAKQEAAALNKHFQHCWVATSSSNSWVNEEFTLPYLKELLVPFPFKRAFWLGTLLKLIWPNQSKSYWRKRELMMLLFQVDAMNTSTHPMYFGISLSKDALWLW